jgi:N6-adenosine-specific RNA methylase IME4
MAQVSNAPLIRYNAACKALAAARSTDEVKEIRNQSEALRAYAIQAKNRQLEIDAGEIRLRAERRLGELLQAQKAGEGFNRGAAAGGKKESSRGSYVAPRDTAPTLADAGIDKKLSSRAQKLAAIPAEEFESVMGQWRGRVERETERVTVNLLQEGERQQRRESVRDCEPPMGKYSTIVIDPPWSYANNSGRQATDYSDVMTLKDVLTFNIGQWVSDECHLYLWVTDAYVGHVYEVTEAWGFEAKTTLVWVKDRFGMGNYYRHQHELCVFAAKGTKRLARMNASTVFHAPVTKHSEKPDAFYELVESCSPGPYLDVFARRRRPGWDVFGDQIDASALVV